MGDSGYAAGDSMSPSQSPMLYDVRQRSIGVPDLLSIGRKTIGGESWKAESAVGVRRAFSCDLRMRFVSRLTRQGLAMEGDREGVLRRERVARRLASVQNKDEVHK